MRLITFLCVVSAMLLPAQTGSADSLSVGGTGSGADASITGRYTSESNFASNGATSVQLGDGPPICYSTYRDYDGNERSVRTDCAAVVDDGGLAPLAPLEPAAPDADQAQDVVRDYLRNLSMPVPQPRMSAPEGISGALHSIDLQSPETYRFDSEDTSFGVLRAAAFGTFVVDWGDGTVTSHSSSGSPWPNRDIAHVYRSAGSYDITVTARWSVDWSLGNFSGVITGLETSGTIDDWSVVEAQAVLIR